jgi:CubicO group peptidase (beta-lactamase class C family)
MPHVPPRRRFLEHGGRAALAWSLLGGRSLASFAPSGPWDRLTAGLDAQVPMLMAELAVPGVSIAIVKDGAIAWRRAFGVRDAASKAPVDTDTIFEAASMSKPVFAYAVMKLCEQGVLDLDRPLSEYAPRPFLENDPRASLITARHVLSHSTGFQNWRSDDEPLAIHFTPGERYGYSGEGFSYLQSVVTHVTRQPIEAFMKAHLLHPFGMSSCAYVWNEILEARAARPHDDRGRPRDHRKRTAADAARYAAAGDLFSTPTEYAKFIVENISPRPADSFRLTAASLREMRRPQMKVDDVRSRGLGWELVHADGDEVIQHGGDNPGFRAFAAASPAHRCGMVVMTNGNSGGALLGRFFAATLRGLRDA